LLNTTSDKFLGPNLDGSYFSVGTDALLGTSDDQKVWPNPNLDNVVTSNVNVPYDVVVTPTGLRAEVLSGFSLTLTSKVENIHGTPVDNENVVWSILPSGQGYAPGTDIDTHTATDAGVTLTVSAIEAQTSITLRATSVKDSSVYKDTVITILPGPGNTPVGGTFSMDGHTWRVLEKDASGNVMILTEYVYYNGTSDGEWNPTATTSGGYAASKLKATIDNFYAGLAKLKAMAKVPSTLGDTTTEITTATNVDAGSQTSGIAFALSQQDVWLPSSGGHLFADNAERLAYDVNAKGTGVNWWTRTPNNGTIAVYIDGRGQSWLPYNSGTVHQYGVRPALWVHP
jgi:hypothetical protein